MCVSDGARATPNRARRFRAMTGSSPPRTLRSNCKSDGSLKPDTARPDIKQSDRLMQRALIGSGTRSKRSRVMSSIPGIDRCLR